MEMSRKQQELLEFYAEMARDGYRTADERYVEHAYNDMEVVAFRDIVKTLFDEHGIRSILDYGCGGSDYDRPGFHQQMTAREYFGLQEVRRFEPARQIDERGRADAVLCFDVLEHVFIADVPGVIRELFTFAGKLLVVNVACFPARALLPNGENAHITVRHPLWWKGMFDAIAPEFPAVKIHLLCSIKPRNAQGFPTWSANAWLESESYVAAL